MLGDKRRLSRFCPGVGRHSPYLSRINAPPKVCDVDGTADNVIELATEYLYETFGMADEILDDSDYLMGDYTAPDAYMFWAIRQYTQFKLT